MVDIVIGFVIGITYIYMIYIYIKSYKIISKYKDKCLQDELSGFEIAEKLLENNDLDNMYIVETKNYLEENYDVKRKVIRMLPNTFHGTKVSDSIYASYLASHAISDKKKNTLLYVRNILFPFINILVYISYIIIILAAFLRDFNFIRLGIVLLFITIIFNLFTLKIEMSSKSIIINEYKKLKYLNKDNEDIINSLVSILAYRYIYNPITLVIILFKTK